MAGGATSNGVGAYLWLFGGPPPGSFLLGGVWVAFLAWRASLGGRPVWQYGLLCAASYALAFAAVGILALGFWSGRADGFTAIIFLLIIGIPLTLLEWSPFAFLAWFTWKVFS